jgi:hypothetical protein
LNTPSANLTSLAQRLGLPFAALLLLAGHFTPWAAHKTAALTLSAHDLAVFTNFTPGAGIFLNEWFYLPLWCAALLIALLARPVSRINRMLVGLFAAVVASLGLPGYPQILTAFRSADYRLQFFASLAVMGLSFALAVASKARLQPRARGMALVTLALVPAVPLAGFWVVKPPLEYLYGAPLGVGAGWWLTLAAIVLLFALGALHWARAKPEGSRIAARA